MSREEIMDDLQEPQQENYELEEFINEIRKYYKTHEFKRSAINDCISRQAAIDALHDEIVRRRIDEDTNDDGALDEFDTEAILRRLLPAQPQRWIPVSERLPKDQTYVLVSTLDNDVQEAHLDGEGRFRDYFGDKVKCVIAWMPLPEPYKGEQ